MKRVVLTFDDAVSNHATFVAPLLKQHAFGATFYVCEFQGDGPDRFESDKHQYMTWPQIAGLDRLGFEIGNHTGHHTSVCNLAREELAREIKFIEDRCAHAGIRRPETFCYPGGGEDPACIPVLREMGYRLARGVGNRPYRPGIDSPHSVPSYVITGAEASAFPGIIAQACDEQIVVLTFHGTPDYNHPWVDTPPDIFTGMMQVLADSGVHVIAMRDLSPPASERRFGPS